MSRRPLLIKRQLVNAIEFLVAVTLCQFLIGSLVVHGYLLARMRFWITQRWLKESSSAPAVSIASPRLARFKTASAVRNTDGKPLLPHWKDNYLIHGATAFVGISLWTAPGVLFMALGWFAGWQVSFHKMYEYSAAGVGLVALGMSLFAVALFSIPIALVRFSLNPSFRELFRLRAIRAIIRARPLGAIGIAFTHLIAAFPFLILVYLAPNFTGQYWDGDMQSGQAMVRQYHWVASLALYPILVALKRHTATVAARGTLAALRTGRLQLEELSPFERATLNAFDLDARAPQFARSPLARIPLWITRAPIRRTLTFLLGFIFAFTLVIGQFFRYSEYRSWAIHPFIHTPWFYYPGASDPVGKDFRPLEKSSVFMDGILDPTSNRPISEE